MKANKGRKVPPANKPQSNGGSLAKKAISPTKPVPIAIPEDRGRDEVKVRDRRLFFAHSICLSRTSRAAATTM
jgi:hypothetical protein